MEFLESTIGDIHYVRAWASSYDARITYNGHVLKAIRAANYSDEASVSMQNRTRHYFNTVVDTLKALDAVKPKLFPPSTTMYLLTHRNPDSEVRCYIAPTREGALIQTWGYVKDSWDDVMEYDDGDHSGVAQMPPDPMDAINTFFECADESDDQLVFQTFEVDTPFSVIRQPKLPTDFYPQGNLYTEYKLDDETQYEDTAFAAAAVELFRDANPQSVEDWDDLAQELAYIHQSIREKDFAARYIDEDED